jgi:hypothetical protein
MEQLCRMAYYGQNICESLVVNEIGSFEPVWKHYDDMEPLVIPQLKELYIFPELVCPGFWSFMREVFPNCEVVYMR